jgi:hypothetical protein
MGKKGHGLIHRNQAALLLFANLDYPYFRLSRLSMTSWTCFRNGSRNDETRLPICAHVDTL